MALGVAFKAFFGALFNRAVSERIAQALASRELDRLPSPAKSPTSVASETPPPQKPVAPTRSDAVTLLATLQREARLIDLVCEPLESFSDNQIGAAAREVLRDCRKSLDRMFSIKPLSEQEEGSLLQIPEKYSPVKMRLLGKSSGAQGVVVHRGWKIEKCELPNWQGEKFDSQILSPVEVEVS